MLLFHYTSMIIILSPIKSQSQVDVQGHDYNEDCRTNFMRNIVCHNGLTYIGTDNHECSLPGSFVVVVVGCFFYIPLPTF